MDYDKICTFFSNYAGKAYRAIAKISDENERRDMIDLRNNVVASINCFNDFINVIGTRTNMYIFYHNDFLDGTKVKTRSYFWGELKSEIGISSPESISIFLEENSNNKIYVRISTEINENRISKKSLTLHNTVLLNKLPKGYVYVLNQSGAKNLNFIDNIADARRMIESGQFRKIQICKVISFDEKTVENDVVNAIEGLKEIYDMLINVE